MKSNGKLRNFFDIVNSAARALKLFMTTEKYAETFGVVCRKLCSDEGVRCQALFVMKGLTKAGDAVV